MEDDDSSESILVSLQHCASQCMRILASGCDGEFYDTQQISSMVDVCDAKDALYRLIGIVGEAFTLEGVEENLNAWINHMIGSILQLECCFTSVPDVVKLLAIMHNNSWTPQNSHRVSARLWHWVTVSQTTSLPDNERTQTLALIICSILNVICNTCQQDKMFHFFDVLLTIYLDHQSKFQDRKTQQDLLVNKLIISFSMIPHISQAVDLVVNFSLLSDQFSDQQNVALVHMAIMLEESRRRFDGSRLLDEPNDLYFDCFWSFSRLDSHLISISNSSAVSSFTTKVFDVICNVVSGNCTEYSQQKLHSFLRRCVLSCSRKVIVTMIDIFLVHSVLENSCEIEDGDVIPSSKSVSTYIPILDTVFLSLEHEEKVIIIEAYSNSLLATSVMLPFLVDISFLIAKHIIPNKECYFTSFDRLSQSTVDAVVGCIGKDDLSIVLHKCIVILQDDCVSTSNKDSRYILAQSIILRIIEGDNDIAFIDMSSAIRKLEIIQALLSFASQLSADVLAKVMDQFYHLLTNPVFVDEAHQTILDLRIYDLLNQFIIMNETSREFILSLTATNSVLQALYIKLLKEFSVETTVDVEINSSNQNISHHLAISSSAWLHGVAGKCAVKPYLEQLVGLISCVEILQIIHLEKIGIIEKVQRIMLAPMIKAGLKYVNDNSDLLSTAEKVQEQKFENLYTNGRNNLQYIIHQVLISYTVSSYLIKALILAVQCMKKIKSEPNVIKEEDEALLPITLQIEALQVYNYLILTVMNMSFQIRKDAVKVKDQTKTIDDLIDLDENISRGQAGYEEIIATLEELDINSFQRIQDVIHLEAKKIQCLRQSSTSVGEQALPIPTPGDSHLRTWNVSVSTTADWFRFILASILGQSKSEDECKLYFWWECKLSVLCHSTYLLHNAIENERLYNEKLLEGDIRDDGIAVLLSKVLSIIVDVFGCYEVVLEVDSQKLRFNSLITNTLVAQQVIDRSKELSSSFSLNKRNEKHNGKKRIPIVMESSLQLNSKYFTSYNGIHRCAHLWTSLTCPQVTSITVAFSSSEEESEYEAINAFRRSAISSKKKSIHGGASKGSVTIDDIRESLKQRFPLCSKYCTSQFDSIKHSLESLYLKLNPLVSRNSSEPSLDFRWLEDVIQPLKVTSLDNCANFNGDAVGGMKIAQLLVNLRFEMISTMCCILRYALDLSSNFSVVLTIASEQNRYFVKQLKQVMLTFVWDLFTLFTSVGIMARTFKDYLRSIAALVDLICNLSRGDNKTAGDHCEEFLWVAFVLMLFFQRLKGLDRSMLRDLIQLILTLSNGAQQHRLISKYLLYCALIWKNQDLVNPTFFESNVLEDQLQHERSDTGKLKTKKKQKNFRTRNKKSFNLEGSSMSSLSSSSSEREDSENNRSHDVNLEGSQNLRSKLYKHFSSTLLAFVREYDGRRLREEKIPYQYFLNICDNKVADAIVHEISTILIDRLTDYHKSMVALESKSFTSNTSTTELDDVKQEDSSNEDSGPEVLIAQQQIIELTDILNLLLIQNTDVGSIMNCVVPSRGTPTSSPSKRKPPAKYFLILKRLDTKTLQVVFSFLTSLLEEIGKETRLLIHCNRGRNGTTVAGNRSTVQPPLGIVVEFVDGMEQVLLYSRLPLLSSCLGIIVPSFLHLGIKTIPPYPYSQNGIEMDIGAPISSLGLYQTIPNVGIFLQSLSSSESSLSNQSPKSPSKTAGNVKKVSTLINRIKSLGQQLSVLSGNILRHNPPLTGDFFQYAEAADNLFSTINEMFPKSEKLDGEVTSRKISNSIAIRLFSGLGNEPNNENESEDNNEFLRKKKNKKNKKRARSRNKIIDEWLNDEIDDDKEFLDPYADLEDFIVGDDVVD